MAKPAFIYAFDNMGPDRFVELCGLLLASRYKGFLLGGVGADGGIDGELDEILGEWRPESLEPLLSEIIHPGQLVVFQFKHKVTARVGQAQSRQQLLNLYQCKPNNTCELHRKLISQNKISAYVLVTNVEVNSQFRNKFIEQCKSENPQIEHYQVIGLDELETWITMEMQLRHLFFPTIFGPPRFNLQIQLNPGFITSNKGIIDVFQVSILNVGTVSSYISSVVLKAIVDGELVDVHILHPDKVMEMVNPKFGTELKPGQKQVYVYTFDVLHEIKEKEKEIFLVEVCVTDEIGNNYSTPISENLRNLIFSSHL